jgi:hypothetical protein
MSKVPITDHVGLPPDEAEQIGRVVAEHRGLDDVFAWGRRQSPPVHPADVIKQDEFTHDVLVPLATRRWLVYGTT